MHDWFMIELTEVFVSTDGRRSCRCGVIGSTMGADPRGTGSNPVEGKGHFFPSYRQLYLSSFSDTPRPTQRRFLQMLDVTIPQMGVGVFHAWLFNDRTDGLVFVSTDGRRACLRGVIGSTMGEYPRGTGSNLLEGNGHFFPSYRQLYLSSFSDTHTHTHTRALTHARKHGLIQAH